MRGRGKKTVLSIYGNHLKEHPKIETLLIEFLDKPSHSEKPRDAKLRDALASALISVDSHRLHDAVSALENKLRSGLPQHSLRIVAVLRAWAEQHEWVFLRLWAIFKESPALRGFIYSEGLSRLANARYEPMKRKIQEEIFSCLSKDYKGAALKI